MFVELPFILDCLLDTYCAFTDSRVQTPVCEGDKVNLLARLDHHNGSLHAICDYSRGEVQLKSTAEVKG